MTEKISQHILDIIDATMNDITALKKALINVFPPEHAPLLRHLWAASIHDSLFIVDICNLINEEGINVNSTPVKRFLNDCGCNMTSEIKNENE